MPGPTELILILVIVMIFFGVGKLPSVLGEMGKGVKAFKDGMKDGSTDARKEIEVASSTSAPAEEAQEVTVKKG